MFNTLDILAISFLFSAIAVVFILFTRYYYIRNRDVLLKINEKRKGVYKKSILMMGGKIFFDYYGLKIEAGSMHTRVGSIGYAKIKLNEKTEKNIFISRSIRLLKTIQTKDEVFDSKIRTRSNDESFALNFLNEELRKKLLDIDFSYNFLVSYNKNKVYANSVRNINQESLEALIGASILFVERLKEMKFIS